MTPGLDLFSLPPVVAPAAAPSGALAGRGIPLRWCQVEDADALMHAIETGHKRPCCVGATGYGKGAIVAETIGRLMPTGKVLGLVDRAHLVHQLADEVERHLGVTCGRVADGVCEGIGRQVVVATVQAMYTPDRSGRPLYEYPQFRDTRAVVVDEGHKFFADCYRAVLDYFVNQHGAVVPLFTATPVASNGARWSSFVDWTPGAEGPCMRTVRWCVRNGYLVRGRQVFVHSKLRLAEIYDRLADADPESLIDDEDGGDELSAVLMDLLSDKNERAAAEFAMGVAKVLEGHHSIIFAPPRVDAAKKLATWVNATGRISCDAVWGGRVDKAEVLERFKRRIPQALTNCQLLTEGYNVATVSAVFMCRLLKTWRLIAQCVGRALRPDPSCVDGLNRYDYPDQAEERRAILAASPKPEAMIADLVGIDGRILQASAVEVMYADESEGTRHEIAEVCRSRQMKPRPDGADSEEADAELREEAKAQLLKRQHEQLADMARRRAMAGDLPADVSVTYEDRPVQPSIATPKAYGTLAEQAMFVAVATQYDAARATDIAARTPRHVLKGMTFSMKRKLEKEGGRPDWNRARLAFPEWAADLKARKAAAHK